MLKGMAALLEEGLYLDVESVEMMVTNVEHVIKASCEAIVEDIAQLQDQ